MPALVVSLDAIRKIFGFPQLDGIIGYDALRTRYTAIDMDGRLLAVSSTMPEAPASAHRIPFEVKDGLIVVKGAINGVHGDMAVDTGDRSALTVFQRFARAKGFYALPMSARNVVTGYGIGGPIRGDVFSSTVNGFRIFRAGRAHPHTARKCGRFFDLEPDGKHRRRFAAPL